eukprot:UN03289
MSVVYSYDFVIKSCRNVDLLLLEIKLFTSDNEEIRLCCN